MCPIPKLQISYVSKRDENSVILAVFAELMETVDSV